MYLLFFKVNAALEKQYSENDKIYHITESLKYISAFLYDSEGNSKLCFELAEAIRRIGSRSVGDCTPTVWSDRTRRLLQAGDILCVDILAPTRI